MTHVNTAHRGARIAAALVAVIFGVTACGQDDASSSVANASTVMPAARRRSANGDAARSALPPQRRAAEETPCTQDLIGDRPPRGRHATEQVPGHRRQLRRRGRRHHQGDQRCRRAVRSARWSDLRTHDQHHRRPVVDRVVRHQAAARERRIGDRRSRLRSACAARRRRAPRT